MKKKAKLLVDIIKSLSLAKTFDEVSLIVKKGARSLTGADGTTLVLKENGFCFYVDEDAIEPLWKGSRFPLESCLSGWSMTRKVSVAIKDIYKDERVPLDLYSKTFVKSLTMTPIRSSDPIGAIGVYWAHEHESSEEEKEILTALADSTSVAIENINLYNIQKKQIEELDRANNAKNLFLMTVSHELRTPLNAILGWSQLLKDKELDESEIIHALETIERSAKNQERIINDLLDTSSIILGKLKIEKTKLNLASVIESSCDYFRLKAKTKEIIINSKIDDENYEMLADPQRIEQIVGNLLSNAIRFSREKEEITVLLKKDEPSTAKIIIIDKGEGIDKEFLPFIFDRFSQADSSTTRQYQGLGLGLSIVKNLVLAHEGEVKAHSEGKGKGAIFTVSLPLKQKLN